MKKLGRIVLGFGRRCMQLVKGYLTAITLSLVVLLLAIIVIIFGSLFVAAGAVCIITVFLIAPLLTFLGLKDTNAKVAEALKAVGEAARAEASNVHPFKKKDD